MRLGSFFFNSSRWHWECLTVWGFNKMVVQPFCYCDDNLLKATSRQWLRFIIPFGKANIKTVYDLYYLDSFHQTSQNIFCFCSSPPVGLVLPIDSGRRHNMSQSLVRIDSGDGFLLLVIRYCQNQCWFIITEVIWHSRKMGKISASINVSDSKLDFG